MNRYIDAELLKADIRPFAEYDSNRSNKDLVRRFEIAIDNMPTADVVECVQRNEEFDRVIEELLEIEAKNDIGYFTSSERSQFNAYVEDLLSMTIERAKE